MIEFLSAFTETGIYTHAVPFDDVPGGGGWFETMCKKRGYVNSTNDAWDWSRVETRSQCINCRIAISKDPEDAKNRNG